MRMQNSKFKIQNFNIKVKTFAFLLGFLPFAFCLLPFPAYAADTSSLKVTPIIISLELLPGKTETHIIELENSGTTPLAVKARFSDFEQASEDGGYILDQDTKTSLAKWMQLSQTDILLAPQEKKTITLTIHLPNRIPLGGYYSLVFFESVSPKSQATTVTSRIGILVLGDIGVFEKDSKRVDILTFSFGDLFQQTSIFPILLRVKNTTLHHLNAKPFVQISPLFGKKEIYPLEEKYIFPGKVRRWQQPIVLNKQSSLGIYKAEIQLSTGQGHQERMSTYIIIFPFQNVLIILVCCVIVWIGYRKRKQLIKAIRILLKG